jgi:hypothetical protein
MDLDVDEAAWPIVTVRWVGIPSDSTLTTFLGCMERWLAGGQRFGLLLDTRSGGGLSPEQRVRVIQHMKSQASLTSKYYVQAMVIDSVVQRTLFYGVNVIFKNPFPSKVFAEPESARAWLESELATPHDTR